MTPDSHWSGALAVPTGPGDCREPAVTVAGEVLHAVWTQGSNLYHAYLSGGSWSAPNRVAVGSQAALATAPDGAVHCLFSAQMLGNVEIYHTTWMASSGRCPRSCRAPAACRSPRRWPSGRTARCMRPGPTLHPAMPRSTTAGA